MARILIGAGLVAVVLMVYSLVDLTVTDDRRIRRLNRLLWVVIIAILPIVGPLAWLMLGKAPVSAVRFGAPDDDPNFTGPAVPQDAETDRRIRELEAQLNALDDESNFDARFRDTDRPETGSDSDGESDGTAETHRDVSPPSDDDGGRGRGRG